MCIDKLDVKFQYSDEVIRRTSNNTHGDGFPSCYVDFHSLLNLLSTDYGFDCYGEADYIRRGRRLFRFNIRSHDGLSAAMTIRGVALTNISYAYVEGFSSNPNAFACFQDFRRVMQAINSLSSVLRYWPCFFK